MDSERQIFSLLSKQWLKEAEKEGNYIQRSKEKQALELDFIIFTRIWGSPSSEWCLLLRNLYSPVPPDGAPAFFIASLYVTSSEKPSWLPTTISVPMPLCFYFYFTYSENFIPPCSSSPRKFHFRSYFCLLLLLFCHSLLAQYNDLQ